MVEAPPPTLPTATPPAEEEPSKGLGMLITGPTVTLAAGLPLTAWGATLYVRSQRSDDIFTGEFLSITMLFFGISGLAAGIGLTTAGAIKFSRYRAWQERNDIALAPSVGRTTLGTSTAGLRLRF